MRRALLLFLVLILAFWQPPIHRAEASSSVIRVPQDYAAIQDAVDVARPGDKVIVDAGEYREHVVVSKSIILQGASPMATVINARDSGPGIWINRTRSVVISGFTVENTGFFDSGIIIDSSSQITLQGNVIQASPESNGTYVYDSNDTILKDNVMTGNAYGIAIQGGFGNLVQGNNSTGNIVGGIGLFGTLGNRIVDNILRKSVRGLELSAGAVGNLISGNMISNNTVMGISFDGSGRNYVVDNSIEFNSGPSFQAGIWFHNSQQNRFYHNNIRNNTAYQVFGSTPGDVVSNFWENVTNTVVETDIRIVFVDVNANGLWDPDETVVYDNNSDGQYDDGDSVIAYARGAVVAGGTVLSTDSRVRFPDADGNGVWRLGEAVVFDENNNGRFEPGEPGLASVGGNYWGDYPGADDGSRGFTGNGIGDSLLPHPCPAGGRPCSVSGPAGVDWYPLMSSWTNVGLRATALATPSGGFIPLSVLFTGGVTGGIAPYSYSWDFGDGVTDGNSSSVFHTFLSAGSYIVTLTVTDRSGSKGLAAVPVTALPLLGGLRVKVVDESLNPINNASLALLSEPSGQKEFSATADGQGVIVWSSLVPGAYVVEASAVGYEVGTKNVTVTGGQTSDEQIILKATSSPGYFVALLAGVGAGAVGVLITMLFLFRRHGKRRLNAGRIPSHTLESQNLRCP